MPSCTFARLKCARFDKQWQLTCRSKRTIIIDRVLQTQDDQQILVTDPTEIKRLTNEHFQTCAGGIHTPKTISDQ